MKVCKNCNKYYNDEAVFCKSCSNKLEFEPDKPNDEPNINYAKQNSHRKNKTPMIMLIVVLVFLVVALLSKDKILYEYYVYKANSEVLSSNSISYYVKALDLKYEPLIIKKIDTILSKDSNAENLVLNLEDHLTNSDFNDLAKNVYVKCAEDSFNKSDYEATWVYLDKACEHEFVETDFKYYDELVTDYDYDYDYSNDTSSYPSYNSYNEYIIYDSDCRYLSASELSYYTSEELGYIRNEIFARHGYVFKQTKYKNYFNSMSWYYPDYSYSGNLSTLNSYEYYNVELIKDLE